MTIDTTKADEVALEIEQAIVSGEIPPGSVLRQEDLSGRFHVSRTPVREALRRLAALGVVSFEPNRGVRVRTLSREELYEAFLVRAELESLATDVAATKRTVADIEELGAAERRFAAVTERVRRGDDEERRGVSGEWVRANHAFHDVIYRIADLSMVERIAKSVRLTFSSQAVWGTGGSNLDDLYEANVRQHRAIRETVAAGTAAGARALAREHARPSFELLMAVRAQFGDQASERHLRSA